MRRSEIVSPSRGHQRLSLVYDPYMVREEGSPFMLREEGRGSIDYPFMAREGYEATKKNGCSTDDNFDLDSGIGQFFSI